MGRSTILASLALPLLLVAGSAMAQLSSQPSPFKEKPAPVAPNSAPSIPCPEYGPRFFRASGSTVCVKVEGRVRGEMELRQRGSGLESRSGSQISGELGFEARAETDYGPVRAVVRARGMNPSGGFSP